MGLLTKFMVMYVMVNMLFIMVQAATLEINPSGPKYYDCSNDFLSQFDQNRCQGDIVVITNATEQLPSGTNPVTEDRGSFFTDTFNAMKNWFLKNTGINYVRQLLSGPGKYISMIGFGESSAGSIIPGAINLVWYSIGLLLIIAFIKGGDA